MADINIMTNKFTLNFIALTTRANRNVKCKIENSLDFDISFIFDNGSNCDISKVDDIDKCFTFMVNKFTDIFVKEITETKSISLLEPINIVIKNSSSGFLADLSLDDGIDITTYTRRILFIVFLAIKGTVEHITKEVETNMPDINFIINILPRNRNIFDGAWQAYNSFQKTLQKE